MKSQLKQIISWILYDFANAPFAAIVMTFVFSSYFSKYIAVDQITGMTLWGFALGLSGIIIGLGAPILGALADATGNKKVWIAFFAGLVIISTCSLYFVKPTVSWTYGALALVVVGNCSYSFAQVFYNSLLPTLSDQKYIGRISGLGWGFGYFGGLICLVITFLFFIPKEDSLPHLISGVQHSNLLVAGWFILFSLPLFIFLKEKDKGSFSYKKVKEGLTQLKKTIKEIKQYKTICGFLVANFFYSDGVLTVLNFGGIYAMTVLKFTFNEVMLFAVVINCIAGASAILFGLVDDRFGPSKLIIFSLIVLIICTTMIIIFKNPWIFWIFGLIVGVFIGPVQSASRSMMAHLVPKDKVAEMFGIYALSVKLSTFIGPLLVGILTKVFSSETAGFSVVLVMLFLGLILMLKFFDHRFQKRFLFF